MKDKVEIVIFNDKSWVRLTEYQKVKEENESLQQKWLESEYEKSKLVSQNEKLKSCYNCKHYKVGDTTCKKNKPHNNRGCFKDWELAE